MTAPTAVPAPVHEYATHIPDRRPQFKTHKAIGLAKNAVINKLRGERARHDMTIYKLADGEYRPWLHIHTGQKREDFPELAPKPPPRSAVAWAIQSLKEREQFHLAQAEAAAAKRRELEASR